MKKQLTSRQKQVLSTIKEILHKKGASPTYKDLMKMLGYDTASSLQRHTDALKDKGYLKNKRGILLSEPADTVQIPLVGNAPCGQPLLAVENIEAYIAYPKSAIHGDFKDYFFLRGIGDSMNESDIHGKNIESGDYVLVKKQSTADKGDRVVALIGDDATIKKYMPDNEGVKLIPESSNPANKTIIALDEILIQGKVVDVVKPEGGKYG